MKDRFYTRANPQSMVVAVEFILQHTRIAPDNLLQLLCFYEGNPGSLLAKEHAKPGRIDYWLQGLAYALHSRDKPWNLAGLYKLQNLTTSNPRSLNTLTSIKQNTNRASLPVQHGLRNTVPAEWIEVSQSLRPLMGLSSTVYYARSSSREKTPEQFIEELFLAYYNGLSRAKTPGEKFTHIYYLTLYLELFTSTDNNQFSVASIIFYQLLMINKIELSLVIRSNNIWSINPEKIARILDAPTQGSSVDKSPTATEKHIQLLKNNKGKINILINWAASSATPLHLNVLNHILKYHSDTVNAPDQFGNTPLINACFYKNSSAIQKLMQIATLNPSIKGQFDFTAQQWAAQLGFRKAKALLTASSSSEPPVYTQDSSKCEFLGDLISSSAPVIYTSGLPDKHRAAFLFESLLWLYRNHPSFFGEKLKSKADFFKARVQHNEEINDLFSTLKPEDRHLFARLMRQHDDLQFKKWITRFPVLDEQINEILDGTCSSLPPLIPSPSP